MTDKDDSTLIAEKIQKFIPFDELSIPAICELLPHFRFYQAGAKKIIFKRGTEDPECHFLLSGCIDLANSQFDITQVCGKDDENILALDASHSIHRHAGVTKTDCSFFAVRREHLELITTWSELTQSWHEEGINDQIDWLDALLTSNIFTKVPPANIQKLLSNFTNREVTLGEVIINEGEEGNECFVIQKGKAIVSRMQNKKSEVLAALTNGALFGEDALISNLPRNATVTMGSSGILKVLTKESFDTLLKQPIISYISEDELAALISEGDTGTVIIDVRLAQEVIANPINRAQAIPLSQLRAQIPSFSDDFIYVVIGGSSAEAAAYILNEAGLKVKVLH